MDTMIARLNGLLFNGAIDWLIGPLSDSLIHSLMRFSLYSFINRQPKHEFTNQPFFIFLFSFLGFCLSFSLVFTKEPWPSPTLSNPSSLAPAILSTLESITWRWIWTYIRSAMSYGVAGIVSTNVVGELS